MPLFLSRESKPKEQTRKSIKLGGDTYKVGQTVTGREDFPTYQLPFKGEITRITDKDEDGNIGADGFWIVLDGTQWVRVNDIIEMD